MASESLAVTTSKAAIGLAAQPIVWWSLVTLKTTGCGLAGGTTIQSIEGVSYLVVASYVLASLLTRARTGTGLRQAELAAGDAETVAMAAATAAAAAAARAAPEPKRAAAQRALAMAEQQQRASAVKVAAIAEGPARLLDAAESLSYVSLAIGLVVGGLQYLDYGYIPSALPVAGAACWT